MDTWSIFGAPSQNLLVFLIVHELDKRIFHLEQERFEHSELASVLEKVLAEDFEDMKPDVPIQAVIFIVEAERCHDSLEIQPFYAEARNPRDTDLYAFKRVFTESEWLWKRKYLGSCSKSKRTIEKTKAQLSQLANPIPQPTSNPLPPVPPFPRRKRPRSEYAAESDSQAVEGVTVSNVHSCPAPTKINPLR